MDCYWGFCLVVAIQKLVKFKVVKCGKSPTKNSAIRHKNSHGIHGFLAKQARDTDFVVAKISLPQCYWHDIQWDLQLRRALIGHGDCLLLLLKQFGSFADGDDPLVEFCVDCWWCGICGNC